MIFGLLAGEVLRSERTAMEKVRALVVYGVGGLAVAFILVMGMAAVAGSRRGERVKRSGLRSQLPVQYPPADGA